MERIAIIVRQILQRLEPYIDNRPAEDLERIARELMTLPGAIVWILNVAVIADRLYIGTVFAGRIVDRVLYVVAHVDCSPTFILHEDPSRADEFEDVCALYLQKWEEVGVDHVALREMEGNVVVCGVSLTPYPEEYVALNSGRDIILEQTVARRYMRDKYVVYPYGSFEQRFEDMPEAIWSE